MNTPMTPQKAARHFSTPILPEGYVPQALHAYTDSKGHILYWRIRLKHPDGRKWLRPMYQDEQGQYHLGEPPAFKNVLKPLYGLHLIEERPEATLFIVEGEYPADVLNQFFHQQGISHTYLAITSGSASSASHADWCPLAKRHCILWPDQDAPGEEYAKQVYANLKSLDCSLQIIDVKNLNLAEGDDCVNWLKNNPSATISDIAHFAQIKQQDIPALKTDNEVITQLATLSALEYDRVRLSEAKALNVRPATLDTLVKSIKAKKTENETPFSTLEPWHEPIDLASLLTEITHTIQRFIICQPETAQTAALWIAMTWVIDVIQVAPLAVITAPEKRCGKSQLLFLLGHLVNRPLLASNITPAALFRTIDAWQPTLLIDETDSFIRENEELRGLLNCGHTRDSAYTVRVVGEMLTPKTFFVWGAKALAGIGHLSDTLMDRAIILELRRKLPHEKVERLRYATPELFKTLTAKLARFSQDYSEAIQQARPTLPEALNDRAQDNWEPLLAIADVAGREWPTIARTAALRLSKKENPVQSIGVELLADVQQIWSNHNSDRILSTELIKALCIDDEKPWATYNRGLPITPRQVASRLKEFGIASNNIRHHAMVAKGYLKSEFMDAFARYLPPYLSATSATPLQPSIHAGSGVADKWPVADTSATFEP